jgi:succinate dehydrogenase/fumarate reductase flavoprotein subunit
MSARTSVDVVVVGGGGSGLAAAAAAADLGRRVVLLEKNPALGGTTAWSVGSVSATCTPHQLRAGIKDYPRHHHEDLALFAGDLADRDNTALSRILTEGAPEMFRWLLAAGLEFVGPFAEPPHRERRMHLVLPNSGAFAFHLGRLCRRLGVDIRLATAAVGLIADRNGVRAVKARLANGTEHEFIAHSGVVLAAGDFSASSDMKARFASELVAACDAVNVTSTGDGIRMGLDQGGVVINGDLVRGPTLRFVPPPRRSLSHSIPPYRWVTRLMRWGFETLPPALLRPLLMRFMTTALAPERDLFNQGAILVDLDGLRFSDELDRPARAAALRREAKAFVVFDATIAQRFEAWPNFISTAPSIAYAYLADYRRTRKDVFHCAHSWADLARSMGVAAAALMNTLQDYNAGDSPAGASPRGDRPALATPPYYALGPAKAYVIFTDGGLRISERMEVVNANGEIVPHLYAAGSNGQSGMLLEGHGHHLGWAFVSGRLAGRNAALDVDLSQRAESHH